MDFEREFGDALDAIPDEYVDRSRFVPPVGSLDATIVLVGEAPGAEEVEQGEPFVGAAGTVLDEVLEAAGVTRDEVYITNVVKVRPPENRTPRRGEIEAWLPLLEAELDRIDPAAVVPMGNVATRAILDTDEGITALRGRSFERDGRVVRPTFHPAATLYDRSKRPQLEEDLKRALGAGNGP